MSNMEDYEKWHPIVPDDDDDIIIDDDDNNDDDGLLDDDDLGDSFEWTPQAYWFTESGGLTGDAYNFLYNADIQGELI